MKKELFKAKVAIWMVAVCIILVANSFAQTSQHVGLKVTKGRVEANHVRFLYSAYIENGDTTENDANGCDFDVVITQEEGAFIIGHCWPVVHVLGDNWSPRIYDKKKGTWSVKNTSINHTTEVTINRKKKVATVSTKWYDGGERLEKYFW